jgi:hypothetical protein
MHESKISEYRAEAAACKSKAEADTNTTTAARWLNVADEWTRMADDLERALYPPANERK